MCAWVFLGLGLVTSCLVAHAAHFPGPAVWSFEIEINADNAELLKAKPRDYVRGRIKVAEQGSFQAGVRLKGQGTFQTLDKKPSFTIDFERFGSSVGPHGLTRLHLNNSLEDPSYLKERIGAEVFASAGIPVPRVGCARVTLNGRSLGLYVLKEGFTEDFLHRHFQEDAGILYESEHAGLDIDEKMDRGVGSSDMNRQEELTQLAAATKDPDLDRRWSRLEKALDMDQFITFTVIEMLICHWDGYTLSRNNFRVHYDRKRNRISFLPAGMDQIFSKADLKWDLPMVGLVSRAVLETPTGRERYEKEFETVFRKKLNITKLTNRVTELVAELEPFLSRQELMEIRAAAGVLRQKIADRDRSLKIQLEEPGAIVPEFVNGVASLQGWKPVDEPVGGMMQEGESVLRIIAGPRTAASWRTAVKLRPGRYVFRGVGTTREVKPLPFGTRHGAALRVVGGMGQSMSVAGTTESAAMECLFEVGEEADIVLSCELRASGGEVSFVKRHLALEIRQ